MINEAEQNRVEAENKRILAEAARAHAESNDGTGRVEAENERVQADLKREHSLNKFFKRAAVGYLILAIGGTIGLYKVSDNNDKELRHEINEYATASCISNIPTLEKHNFLVNTNIKASLNASVLAIAQRRFSAAKLHKQNVKNLQKTLLHVPTKQECQTPILKP